MCTSPSLLPAVFETNPPGQLVRSRSTGAVEIGDRLSRRQRQHVAPRIRRRRLKREVRFAGIGLLVLCPVLGLCWGTSASFRSPRPSDRGAQSEVSERWGDLTSRRITLSIAPDERRAAFDGRSPRVRPAGYLLPGDGSEGVVHGDPRD